MAEGDTLYVVFLDISNAFPSADHSFLWLRMQTLGLTVSLDGFISDTFQAGVGVLIGDPLSPTLWNILMAGFTLSEDPNDALLIPNVWVSHLEHADDGVLVCKNPIGLQKHLDSAWVWEGDARLLFHALKSVAMVFGPIPKYLPPFKLGGIPIPFKASHCYIGVYFVNYREELETTVLEHAIALDDYWIILNKRLWIPGEVTVSEYLRIKISPENTSPRYVAIVDTCYLVQLGETTLPYWFSHADYEDSDIFEFRPEEYHEYLQTRIPRINDYYRSLVSWEDVSGEQWNLLFPESETTEFPPPTSFVSDDLTHTSPGTNKIVTSHTKTGGSFAQPIRVPTDSP
ncbi:hypothetical protein D9758_017744 [Tetrapyrgos nigripes]|uniref:Reverse transcriptase domain-containing protein n=1 Tax=Tetrapyrgos nigripes TaxID=182062 RepID=A0A8H5BLE2_9AGAR|nr:hypothetical protein D9758_017744 [Tetrapyrgos nigripes]